MNELTELLESLNKIAPINTQDKMTSLERFHQKASKCGFWIISAIFLMLIILMCWHYMTIWYDIPKLPNLLLGFVKVIVTIAVVLPFIDILFELLIAIVIIWNFKSHSCNWFLLEISHDKKAANKLQQYSRKTLLEAEEWLQRKCLRMKNKMTMFMGNADKYAVFSLAGLGWSGWKILSEKSPISPQSLFDGNITHSLIIAGTAFLTGISLGAILMNYQLQRYVYQLELIEITLKDKANQTTRIRIIKKT